MRPKRHHAFSLIEVVVALAIFAGAATVILALLPGLSRRGTDAADRLAAQRLPAAVRLELARLASGGLAALAAQVPYLEDSAPGLVLAAARNGARVAAGEESFFRIECRRFPTGPLAYLDGDAMLVVAVRVTWPGADASPPAETDGREFIFVTAVTR
jgi:prepilin-type N-terminal cleavage/methylation domain-containing protein